MIKNILIGKIEKTKKTKSFFAYDSFLHVDQFHDEVEKMIRMFFYRNHLQLHNNT